MATLVAVEDADADYALKLHLAINGDVSSVAEHDAKTNSDAEYARRLYEEDKRLADEHKRRRVELAEADALVAKQLQTIDPSEDEEVMLQRAKDEAFARQLHQEERDRRIRAMAQEEQTMRSTPEGLGVVFVRDVLQDTLPDGVKPLARDDMVYMAQKFFAYRETLRKAEKPFAVSVVWHWTKQAGLQTIQEHGLLTRQEQSSASVKSAGYAGNVFGPGIYTANNPKSFKQYGQVCLACFALRGKEQFVGYPVKDYAALRSDPTVDTVIGNKSGSSVPGHRANEIVLGKSDQILPVLFSEGGVVPSSRVQEYMEQLLKDFFR